MNIKQIIRLFTVVVFGLSVSTAPGCSLFKGKQKEDTTQQDEQEYEEVMLPGTSINGSIDEDLPEYKPSEKRVNDLLHTKLEISFDYEKQHVLGKAYLTFKPYFYSTNTLTLDAKGFDIHTIRLNNKLGDTLAYTYDDKEIIIKLNKTYTREQQYVVYIDYTAKPNEIKQEKSGGYHAITADKGVYFIDPLGEDENKPTQIWTQGETEASSCWFPTIDAPNEKTTQEIFVTVDQKYLTISNGELVYAKRNANGTRTDYWRQNLPHAPYLFMLTVGEFAMVKDEWKDMDVIYYVEKEYEQYAKQIFGNTPEMIEFYSNILDYPYPWDKYSQVVVRDFVSGAMENTGAVIHGAFLQQDSRSLLDNNHEDVIAHELFHHWFGDLVTCESWANLPLNESFATYGEYLWFDYKYGKEAADYHLHRDLEDYLRFSQYAKKDMIRYYHESPDEMFDAHSYQKGGRILHMLRNYVGDEAFFLALNKYLKTFQYKSAEIHDLRLIFEEVTGEDLNWFFNQWFFNSGHPKLDIVHDYNAEKREYTLKVYQRENNYFRLPVKIAVYEKGKATIHEVEVLPEELNEFTFTVSSQPDWVNFDSDKMLLCEKTEERDAAQWIYQFNNAKNFIDKLEVLEKLPDFAEQKKESSKVLVYTALGDDFWNVRSRAIELATSIDFIGAVENTNITNKIKEMAQNDPKAFVRSRALGFFGSKEDKAYTNLFKAAVGDSSYNVMGKALREYAVLDKNEAVDLSTTIFEQGNLKEKAEVLGVLARYGEGNYLPYFDTMFSNTASMNVVGLIFDYSLYLKKADPFIKLKGVEMALMYEPKWGGGMAPMMFGSLYRSVKIKVEEEIKEIDNKLQTATVDTEISELSNNRELLTKTLELCNTRLNED